MQRASEIPWERFGGMRTLGITAGASAPELLVDEMVAAFRARYRVTLEQVSTAEEDVVFNLPRALREPAAQ